MCTHLPTLLLYSQGTLCKQYHLYFPFQACGTSARIVEITSRKYLLELSQPLGDVQVDEDFSMKRGIAAAKTQKQGNFNWVHACMVLSTGCSNQGSKSLHCLQTLFVALDIVYGSFPPHCDWLLLCNILSEHHTNTLYLNDFYLATV